MLLRKAGLNGKAAAAPFGWASIHEAARHVAQQIIHVGTAAPGELRAPHAAKDGVGRLAPHPQTTQQIANQQRSRPPAVSPQPGNARPASAYLTPASAALTASASLPSCCCASTLPAQLGPAPLPRPGCAPPALSPAISMSGLRPVSSSVSSLHLYSVAAEAEATQPRLPRGTAKWLEAAGTDMRVDASSCWGAGSAETTESPCAKWLLQAPGGAAGSHEMLAVLGGADGGLEPPTGHHAVGDTTWAAILADTKEY